jgi:hypothetical protein
MGAVLPGSLLAVALNDWRVFAVCAFASIVAYTYGLLDHPRPEGTEG